MSGDTARRIFERNLANYSSPSSVDAYTRAEGLWPIERELLAGFAARPPASLLDIGCGAGRTTVGLAAVGYQVVAIDLAEPLLAHARRRSPGIDYRLMDATRLAFDAATFDIALFSYNGIDVIVPLAERRRCIDEVFRVLRPGGTFVLSTHNAIGHFFSGGFAYVKGYLNAVRMLAAQRGNPYLRDWYFRYDDPGGAQLLYSGPPARTDRQLADAGFEVLAVRGTSGEGARRRILLREPHVYFVARKPA